MSVPPPEEASVERPAPARIRLSARTLFVLLLLPLAWIGPSVMRDHRFLPQLPVHLAPLEAEHPKLAKEARLRANWVTSDRIFPFLTDQLAMGRALEQGSLPTWDPDRGLGVPLFADSLAAAAYPPNWLAFVLPPELAAAPLAMNALFLAGLGMWLFLARLGLGRGAATAGALAVQASTWAALNLHYPMKVDAALWFPWCLWAVEGHLRGRPRAGSFLAVATGLSFLAGFVPIAIFVALGTAIYAAVRALGRTGPLRAVARERGARLRATLTLGAYQGLGLCLAAVHLVPMVEASLHSVRQGRDAANVATGALPTITTWSVLVPELFGSPQEPYFGSRPVAWWLTPADEWEKAMQANPLEWNAFAGVVVVLVAFAGLWDRPRRALFPLGLLVGIFGFAQGWPALRWLYALPGLNLGDPGRVLALQWFLWPWLFALGVQSFVEYKTRAILAALGAGFALAVTAFLGSATFDPATWAQELPGLVAARYELSVEELRESLPIAPEHALLAGRRLAWAASVVLTSSLAVCVASLACLLFGRTPASFAPRTPLWKLGLPMAGILALGIAPHLYHDLDTVGSTEPLGRITLTFGALLFLANPRRARHRPTLAAWLPLALAVGAEGIAVGSTHLVPRDTRGEELFPPSASMEAVRRAAGDGRVLRYDQSPSGVGDVLQLARPNLPWAYGVRDLTPFMVLYPRLPVELFSAVDPGARRGASGLSRLSDATLLDHPVLDLLRVTAILSRTPLEHPRLELEHAGAEFYVYHRRGAAPPARLVPEGVGAADDAEALDLLTSEDFDWHTRTVLAPGTPPGGAGRGVGGSVAVRRPAPNRIDLAVEGSSGGWLVVHDQWYPGWKATIDGEDAVVERVDHTLMGLWLSPGSHGVRLWYEPWSLRIGTTLSLLALAFSLWRAWPRAGRARS